MVTRDVHVQRQDFNAWGEKLEYFRDGDWAQLTGQPKLQRLRDTMTADTVNAYYYDGSCGESI